MSINTSCPNCEAPYTLAESQRGKKVRCRKCTNIFVVGGSNDDAPAPAGARDSKLRKDGMSTSPRPASRTPPPKTRPASIPRDRDREDDDEEDGPPRKPNLKKKSGSSTPMILMIIGGVLLLFLMCGGVAIFGAYWWTRNTVTDIGNNFVDNINQNMPNDPNNPIQINVPPGFPQPPVFPPNDFPFGDNPKDVGEALAWINGDGDANRRNRAADWLARAAVDDARQKDVAKALEGLAKNPNTHDAAIRGLATWATADDCPTLMKEASDLNGPAADALVRLQYEPAAAVFARHLGDFGGGHNDAARRLNQMGKMAEKEVLKYMNAPGDAHAEALTLLAAYGTTDDVKFAQCLKDLKNPSTEYVRNACDSIAKTPVDEARRVEVSKALEAALSDSNRDTRKAAVVALKTWGTKDNVPALIAEMDRRDDFFGGAFEECVSALVKLKDEKGAQAIAAHLPDFGGNRDVVVKGLRDIGPIAEKYVVVYVNHRDEGVRQEADKLLKGYGTKGDVVFDAMVADLDAKETQQRKAACEYFLTQPVDAAKQKTVDRALEKLLDDKDIFGGVPDLAAKTLGVWGDKDSGTALIVAMQKKDSKCWQTSVDALVKLKEERAVVPLILATQDFFHKDAAKKALIEMGPVVETALDNIVADQTTPAADRIVACRLLGDATNGIGTAKSLPVLLAASMDANAQVKQVATAAYMALKKRNP